MAEYKHVEDGYHNGVKPVYVEIVNDYFCEDSTQVKLAFGFGEGFEQPVARLALVYAPGHIIKTWDENGIASEHKATEEDQRNALFLLARLFPAWAEFCKGEHTTEEKINWFSTHSDEVKAQTMDIRVKHSDKGFANAYVMDPAKSKKAEKPRVMKTAAMTRASAALAAVFGGANDAGGGAASTGAEPLPF